MTINVLCPACLTQREIDDQYEGRRASCGVCKFVYTLTSDTRDDWPQKTVDNPFLPESTSSATQVASLDIRDAIVVDDGMFVLTCDCQKRMRVPLHAQGKSIQCPGCKQVIVVNSLPVAEAFWEDSSQEGNQDEALAQPSQNHIAKNLDATFCFQTAVPTKSLIRRNSRTYIHAACGGATTVDGGDFDAMSNPLFFMHSSYCATCDDNFPVSELRWQDTNETIASYYERYRRNVSPFVRAIAKRDNMLLALGGLVGVLLGCVIGFYTGWIVGLVLAVIFAVIGLVATFFGWQFLMKTFVYKSAFGTCDTRELT